MSEDQATAAAQVVTIADQQQKQAARYLNARFGPDWLYKAPETIGNIVEQWIWSVASGAPDYGETCIAAIEAHVAEREA